MLIELQPSSGSSLLASSSPSASGSQAVESVPRQDTQSISVRAPLPIITQQEMKMHLDRLFMQELFKEDLQRVTRWDLLPEQDDPMVQEILRSLQEGETTSSL
ncbi:hypothetical protein [Magnetococcus marinus]|uniref:hypothetical protein n=1 Tax=Magnetococcus marinus TaxID=1124597 RepID=UPI0000381A95|nr:hypothetical protein [Magnetococcus marinus]